MEPIRDSDSQGANDITTTDPYVVQASSETPPPPLPPRKSPFQGATLRRRTGFRTVTELEALPFGLYQKAIWAGDVLATDATQNPFPYVPTESVTVDPTVVEAAADSRATFVRDDDPFEIRVVGMSTVQTDTPGPFSNGANELLLYSHQYELDPTSGKMRDAGMPTVHFHYKEWTKVRPDKYQEVPFSRSLAFSSHGATRVKAVNIAFKILELDEVDGSVKDAIQGIENLGAQMTKASAVLPYLAAVSPALQISGAMSRKALDAYAKPDRVLAVDAGFRIAPSGGGITGRHPGEFLRYGYYFFLSEAVRMKLNASVTAFNQVCLMVRRVEAEESTEEKQKKLFFCGLGAKRGKRRKPAEPEFLPLRYVSYLVVKVSPAVADWPAAPGLSDPSRERTILSETLTSRLQLILQSAKDQPADELKSRIVDFLNETAGDSLGRKTDESEAFERRVEGGESLVGNTAPPAAPPFRSIGNVDVRKSSYEKLAWG